MKITPRQQQKPAQLAPPPIIVRERQRERQERDRDTDTTSTDLATSAGRNGENTPTRPDRSVR